MRDRVRIIIDTWDCVRNAILLIRSMGRDDRRTYKRKERKREKKRNFLIPGGTWHEFPVLLLGEYYDIVTRRKKRNVCFVYLLGINKLFKKCISPYATSFFCHRQCCIFDTVIHFREFASRDRAKFLRWNNFFFRELRGKCFFFSSLHVPAKKEK